MSNSSLVSVVRKSPNNSGTRTMPIDRITPHCVVGQMSAAGLGDWFSRTSTQASSNYGIGYDGKVGLYVDESMRSWCTSSSANDQRAVTIECASDTTAPYAFRPAVYESLIKLCVDICERNGKWKLLWLGDKTKSLNYSPKSDEMVLTVHRWFANKSCPGDWMFSRMGELATKVSAQLAVKKAAKEAADAVKPSTPETPAPSTPSTPSASKLAGQAVILSKAPLYASSSATTVSSYITGTYYYWSSEIVNKRIRITNSKSRVGLTGQVTGWIDAPGSAPAQSTTDLISPSTLKAGQIFKVTNIPIYGSATSTKVAKTITGTYYLWSTQIVTGRIRITNALSRVGVSGQVTGWVNVSDLGIAAKKSIDEVAREVIEGKWGNGTERKKKLEAAGYNYAEVQARVNKILGK